MALPEEVKQCIRERKYEVIVREEPLLVIIQSESNRDTASRTICTLTLKLQEGTQNLFMDLKEPLDLTLARYIVQRYFEIGTKEGKSTFYEAFAEVAGASRHNL